MPTNSRLLTRVAVAERARMTSQCAGCSGCGLASGGGRVAKMRNTVGRRRMWGAACTVAAVAAAVGYGVPGGPADAQPQQPDQPAPSAITDPAQYVNPFVGTKPGGPDFGHGGGAGDTFPGADAPFGMVQWSPDTVTYQHGGYFYDDNRIRGFSLTHLSGAGCADF